MTGRTTPIDRIQRRSNAAGLEGPAEQNQCSNKKSLIKKITRAAGYEVINLKSGTSDGLLPHDFSDREVQIYVKVRPYTMTTPERVVSLVRAIVHVVCNDLPGAIVECGVYKGGSMMAAALALIDADAADRDLCLYDTFAGMTEPGEHDGAWEKKMWGEHQTGDHNEWAFGGSAEQITQRLVDVGYARELLHLVEGDILETLPRHSPEQIALLRLDTDFYESTRHELEHLYPKLVPGGILIIDDYGVFQGTRKAVDEYFAANGPAPFLSRIDADARLVVKPVV